MFLRRHTAILLASLATAAIAQSPTPLTFTQTFSVPSGDSEALLNIFKSLQGKTGLYKVVLDAGKYYFTGRLAVPPNVALEGAGRRFTTIFIDTGSRNDTGYFDVEAGTGISEVSNMSITGNGYAIFTGANVVISNVSVSTFSTQISATRFSVFNSQVVIAGNPDYNNFLLSTNGGPGTLSNVEMPIPTIRGGRILCLNSYTGVGVLLTPQCQ